MSRFYALAAMDKDISCVRSSIEKQAKSELALQ
jgi:hypothetical protein